MKLSELLLCSTNSGWLVAAKRIFAISRAVALPLLFTFYLLPSICLSAENETTISLEEDSPKVEQEIAQTKDTKKEINNLYKSAERYRKNKKLLFAVEKYKEALEKDPYHKKSRERLSDMYTETKYKVDEKILYKSEEVYYAMSILYFINCKI